MRVAGFSGYSFRHMQSEKGREEILRGLNQNDEEYSRVEASREW